MSKKITIPMGPQHPSLKEPACFTITLEGEKVVSAIVWCWLQSSWAGKKHVKKEHISKTFI